MKEVLFTLMVNRYIFENQNTFSMYITTTDECVPKHLKNSSSQADNETDDAPSDHVQASIGTVITKATTLPILGLTWMRSTKGNNMWHVFFPNYTVSHTK